MLTPPDRHNTFAKRKEVTEEESIRPVSESAARRRRARRPASAGPITLAVPGGPDRADRRPRPRPTGGDATWHRLAPFCLPFPVNRPELGRKRQFHAPQSRRPRTRNRFVRRRLAPFAILSTRVLAKHKVAGSTPVTRSPEAPWKFRGLRISAAQSPPPPSSGPSSGASH